MYRSGGWECQNGVVLKGTHAAYSSYTQATSAAAAAAAAAAPRCWRPTNDSSASIIRHVRYPEDSSYCNSSWYPPYITSSTSSTTTALLYCCAVFYGLQL